MERRLGDSLPFSVGTAIPFEENVVVESPQVTNVWINGFTFIRNFLGSYGMDFPEIDVMFEGLHEELDTITSVGLISGVDVKVYIPNYDSVASHLKLATLKQPSTDKQKLQRHYERTGVKVLKGHPDVLILKGARLPDVRERVHVITHLPIDLLSRYSFETMVLMESHTGRIKGPMEWITKLTKNDNFTRLPFNVLTLQVLGDRGAMFQAAPHFMKKALLEVATVKKWTPATTNMKVDSDIANYDFSAYDKKGDVKKTLLAMLRSKVY